MSLERHGTGPSTFYTTSDFWECGCKDKYTHLVLLEKCDVCGALRDESPDARVSELITISRMCKESVRIINGTKIL
jgi:hypothetical protein